MKYAFGGSENYAGKDLATAHEHLIREKGLNVKHFDLVAGHFVDAMHEVRIFSPLYIRSVFHFFLSLRQPPGLYALHKIIQTFAVQP